jgi:uncharacterized RDD family membrane protein YckC
MTTPTGSGAWTPPPDAAAGGRELGGYAGRFIAYVIDGIAITVAVWVVVLVIAVPLGISTDMGTDVLTSAFSILLVGAVFVAYFGYFPIQWARSGQTIGMRLLGIRVIDEATGGNPSMGQAILRLVGLWISIIAFYLGLIWIFVDKRRRGWHDLIGKTLVVKA